MNYLTHALREHQELAVFLTLAIGFLIGRVRIGTFSLGTAVGTLLAGVAIGQLNIQVAAVVKYVFFDLFLFTTGYKVGPQFFRALKKDALPQLALTLVAVYEHVAVARHAAIFDFPALRVVVIVRLPQYEPQVLVCVLKPLADPF